MKFSKKKKISFLVLGSIGVGLVATTTTLSLSSCSSSSNPYYPSIDLNVSINSSTQKVKYYFDTTSKNFFYVDTATNTKFSLSDLLKNVYNFKGNGSTPFEITPELSTTPNAEYDKLVVKANDAYIASQVMSYFLSFIENGLKVLLNAPVFSQVQASNTSFDVADLSTRFLVNDAAKEFALGYNESVGQGYNIFSLGPKTVNIDLEIVDKSNINTALQQPIFKPGQVSSTDPNMDAKIIKVKSFNIDFSWWKHLRSGGEWVNDIKLVNDNLTSSQLSYVKEKIYNNAANISGFKNLNYSFSFNNTTIQPELFPQFNFMPNLIEYTDKNSNTKSKLFNGIGSITKPSIKSSSNSNYEPDPNQSEYNIFGLNNTQTLSVIVPLFDLLKNSIHNNKNDVLYNTYNFFYSVGYYSLNPTATVDSCKTTFDSEIKQYQSKFVLNKNINEWNILKVNKNYTKGLDLVYTYFQINQQPK